MTDKQRNIVIIFGVLVLIGIVLGVVFSGGQSMIGPGLGGSPAGGTASTSKPIGYVPTTPQGATLTTPQNDAPASPNIQSGTMARFFDLRVSASGFNPSTLTVNKGDTIHLNLMPTDGNYDFEIPYLPFYTSAVSMGQSRTLVFDTATPGTFEFRCRDFCPRSGAIKGSLIVLPRK
ncbi:MAG: cupredoxin domain-containing protein [Minisyncoccia bacterium]|jgi:heme/copper-type cytochrome/quinol oxidase subunit 2